MGFTSVIRATRANGSSYTFITFTFGKGSKMHLTTSDRLNPYSRSVTVEEFQTFQDWLRNDRKKKNTKKKSYFVFKTDDVYAHVSIQKPATAHFRSRHTSAFLFTYIPTDFLLSV
ncbi:hypothetical protein ElyMa_003967200 [Elysia marginata]|uniref:Uncharacterized protein n=1 Tax=Elysia marginata TaxID=1093978 RepID=A0AAV4FVC9_9GAST|nr:hypothetical protein ElyMa_003967200 [Elysia marginata]